ncbi:cofactor FMO1 FAD enzyme [Podospora didyma]|uniref:Cofactor FMO1 FAD enzyme n=1 Tax=Podospora didyma TaxID=330526 RepID=A0AAE0NSD5_9PEZI|nr:cofactor FMO1 FAD enzyme [Podospora didyma]
MIDILIIGAGPSGLCAAKTFLQHNAAANIVLIDAHSTVGGVWAAEQLYPTLRTNNLFSSPDFTDFPMDPERFGIKPGQHITGEAMHAYLSAYADHFGVLKRIRFNTKAIKVYRRDDGSSGNHDNGGWDVEVQSSTGEGETSVLSCRKLVVATGVLSVPKMPKIKGMEDFGAPLLHSCDLGSRVNAVLEEPGVTRVAVLGGGKSAYDAVYLAATTGHKVEWIIRRSGHGPAWVFPTHTYLGPFRAWRERLVTRRVLSFMSPCVWPDYSGFGWLRDFLHVNSVGKFIAGKFWGAIHADTVRDCRYRTDQQFKVLEPELSPFWYGTVSGVLNYETDFLSLISSGQVRVHRADISHLSDNKIHLTSGNEDATEETALELDVDALIAATGYSAKPAINFSPSTSLSDLGVPTTSLDKTQAEFWADLDAKSDQLISQQFPQLLSPPSKAEPLNTNASVPETVTPWRLYRGIAPPGPTASGDRSLVFLGMFSNIANTIRLEMQCLWALAYLNNKIPNLENKDEDKDIYAETSLAQRWCQLRAPYGHGHAYPDLVFDQMPYWDLLLHDLGLATRRKPSAFRELFEAYTQADYCGVVDEWLAKNGYAS